jgi:hypothetical protein
VLVTPAPAVRSVTHEAAGVLAFVHAVAAKPLQVSTSSFLATSRLRTVWRSMIVAVAIANCNSRRATCRSVTSLTWNAMRIAVHFHSLFGLNHNVRAFPVLTNRFIALDLTA